MSRPMKQPTPSERMERMRESFDKDRSVLAETGEPMKRAAEVLKGDRGAARHRLGGNAVIGGLDRSREPARGL